MAVAASPTFRLRDWIRPLLVWAVVSMEPARPIMSAETSAGAGQQGTTGVSERIVGIKTHCQFRSGVFQMISPGLTLLDADRHGGVGVAELGLNLGEIVAHCAKAGSDGGAHLKGREILRRRRKEMRSVSIRFRGLLQG